MSITMLTQDMMQDVFEPAILTKPSFYPVAGVYV